MKYKVETFPKDLLIGLKCSAEEAVEISLRAGKANRILCTQIEITAVNSTGRRITCVFSLNNIHTTRVIYREWVIRAWNKMSGKWPYDE